MLKLVFEVLEIMPYVKQNVFELIKHANRKH